MVLEKYKDLLSVKDLAEIFDVSEATIYKEIKAGSFGKPVRIGRTYKIPRILLIEKFFVGRE